MDGLLESDHGIHPDIVVELTVVLLQEDITGPAAAVETEILDPTTITTAADYNISITNTTRAYDDIYDPTLIFTTNPTTEA